MQRTVVHIGFPKCASTSLQQNLFALHPEIQYFEPLIELYRKTFSDVYVVPLKMLAKEREQTIRNICDFCGVSDSVGWHVFKDLPDRNVTKKRKKDTFIRRFAIKAMQHGFNFLLG